MVTYYVLWSNTCLSNLCFEHKLIKLPISHETKYKYNFFIDQFLKFKDNTAYNADIEINIVLTISIHFLETQTKVNINNTEY